MTAYNRPIDSYIFSLEHYAQECLVIGTSGAAILRKERQKAFLESYVKRFIEEMALDTTVNDALAPGDKAGLAVNGALWMLFSEFIVQRSDKYVNESAGKGLPKTYGTATSEFQNYCAIFKALTGSAVSRDIVKKCHDVIKSLARNYVKPKPSATWGDIQDIICNGVFNESVRLRHPRERTQVATFLCLLAFTGSRPGEICLGDLQADSLKWGDVSFSIVGKLANDKLQPRLCATVTIRNLKGMRDDPSK